MSREPGPGDRRIEAAEAAGEASEAEEAAGTEEDQDQLLQHGSLLLPLFLWTQLPGRWCHFSGQALVGEDPASMPGLCEVLDVREERTVAEVWSST